MKPHCGVYQDNDQPIQNKTKKTNEMATPKRQYDAIPQDITRRNKRLRAKSTRRGVGEKSIDDANNREIQNDVNMTDGTK